MQVSNIDEADEFDVNSLYIDEADELSYAALSLYLRHNFAGSYIF